VAENDEAMFSICHIWPRDVIDDVELDPIKSDNVPLATERDIPGTGGHIDKLLVPLISYWYH
jgi:hypothetical protein